MIIFFKFRLERADQDAFALVSLQTDYLKELATECEYEYDIDFSFNLNKLFKDKAEDLRTYREQQFESNFTKTLSSRPGSGF